VDILSAHIEHEETRTGVREVCDPAYPVLARGLRARRENIGASIAVLEAAVQGRRKAVSETVGNVPKFTGGLKPQDEPKGP
jgi:ABC-type transporter Mla subunit MlaD